MASFKVKNVRKITNDANGNPINLTLIDVVGKSTPIIRRPKEFLQDLKNSFLINDNITSINHPSVLEAMKGLRGGTLSGQVAFAKKGDKWTVTENSRCVTDPNHVDYGKLAVGDEAEVTRDQARVTDGFLTLTESMQAQALKANASAYAQLMVDQSGAFDFDDEPVSSEASFDEIPDELVAETMQSNDGGEE